MSTLPKLLVLPLIASALIIPDAAQAGTKGEPQAPKASQTTKKGHKAKRHHHHRHHGHHHGHHHHRHAKACCRVVETVPMVIVRRPCPPDFADQWYAQARLAWVGPTRCYPFQPNGFYPMPDYRSINRPTIEQIESEPEIVGDLGK